MINIITYKNINIEYQKFMYKNLYYLFRYIIYVYKNTYYIDYHYHLNFKSTSQNRLLHYQDITLYL